MKKLVPFRAWHFDWLGETLELGGKPGPDVLAVLEKQSSWTGVVDGQVVFCAGVVAQWPTRHTAWAMLAACAQKDVLWVTREIRAGLATLKGRIELTVRADFPQGQRWAEMLGFRVETPLLPMYGPEQEDHIGYVRIN